MLFNYSATTDIYTLSLHDALPISLGEYRVTASAASFASEEQTIAVLSGTAPILHFELKLGSKRSEEHTSELQSRFDLVCRLLLEKKKNITIVLRRSTHVYSLSLVY